jgi:hypothetical protein
MVAAAAARVVSHRTWKEQGVYLFLILIGEAEKIYGNLGDEG